MLNTIKTFFKELFKDDIGKYDPEAEKVHFKQVLYWIIGLIIAFLIPACLVYLEVGEFDWNVFKFIWGEDAQNYGNVLYRGEYFMGGFCANVFFLAWGFLSTYRINGKKEMLELKITSRFFCLLGFTIAIVSFILAIVL
jgi:hypothetical protein